MGLWRGRLLVAWVAIAACTVAASAAAQDVEPASEPESAEEVSLFGYTKEEGFRLRSEDGNYKLQLAMRAGLKLEPSWTDGDGQMNEALAFLRPVMRGNLFKKWLGFTFSMELAANDPFVLDAFVDIAPWEELGFVVGQQGTPISRHSNFGPHTIFFPEFAAVSNYFWSGRERGVTAYGALFDQRLDYFLGVFGGSPIDVPASFTNNYLIEARLTANPLGPVNPNEHPFTPEGEALPLRVSFTAQGYYGKLQTNRRSYNAANTVLDPFSAIDTDEAALVAGDLWFQGGRVIVFAEAYYRRLDPVGVPARYTSRGAWMQAIVNVYRNVIGAGVRLSYLDPSADVEDDEAFGAEGQLAYFILPPLLTFKVRYAWVDQEIPSVPAVQLPFLPGTTHLATAQLMLAF